MARYSKDDIQAIRELAGQRFEQILSHYALLAGFDPDIHSSGHGFECRCPLHYGKGHNFHWMERGRTWRCWSKCGTSGTIFDFVMRIRGYSFRDALDDLAGLVGYSPKLDMTPIYVPERVVSAPEPMRPLDRDELVACDGRHEAWKRIQPWVREYLGGGYCWRRSHPLYGRITFPVYTTDNTLVGIVGRITGPEPPHDASEIKRKRWECKYLNFGASKVSEETGKARGGFAKGQVLYHYQKAQHETGVPLVLAEGPFDVARVVEHGWFAVAAIFGSDISAAQWEILRAHHDRIIYGLDPDTFELFAPARPVFKGDALLPSEQQLFDALRNTCDPHDRKGEVHADEDEVRATLGWSPHTYQNVLHGLIWKGRLDGKYCRVLRQAAQYDIELLTLRLPTGRDLGDTTATEFYRVLQEALYL